MIHLNFAFKYTFFYAFINKTKRGLLAMRESKTALEILKRLEDKGFRENFMAGKKGLFAIKSKNWFLPQELIIEEFFRLEGETDLNEETIIFALSCPKKHVFGVYQVAFGRMMDDLDAKIVTLLKKRIANPQGK
jgi:hypothetical protein